MNEQRERRYIAAADLLRIFCVGGVAWFHIWQQSWLDPGFAVAGVWVDVSRLVRRGYMLVDLMLLLSGFLLYWPEALRAREGRPFSPAAGFYRRRAARILPSYLFAVLTAAAVCLFSGPVPGSPPLWQDLLTHLSFTTTFTRPTYLWTNLNGVLWTLAVEVQIYLLFPLIGRLFRRSPVPVWAFMTALALFCRGLVSRFADPTMFFNQLPCMLDLYAFGMMTAHLLSLRKKGEGSRRRKLVWALVSVLALLGILEVLWQQHPVDGRDLQLLQLYWRLPLAVLGGVYLYAGGCWGARISRAVGNPPVRFLAGISYNFYIWHQYLAVKLKELHLPPYTAPELPQMTEGLGWQRLYNFYCWAAALLAAVLATYLIEKPAAQLLGKRRERP